ncbi:MAG: hypothetical protein WEA09_12245 [Gemmatimonadota bacterium]
MRTLGPQPLVAQTPRGLNLETSTALTTLLSQGDAHHDALQPLEAWESYAQAQEEDPESYSALWKMAREGVFLAMLAEGDEAKRWMEEAEEAGRKTVALEPEGTDGLHWLGAALGLQALNGGPRTRVSLAREIRVISELLVETDSLYAGGHHLLGHWHAEASRVTGFTRFLARRVLGASELEEASWEAAERHLRAATQLAPDGLIHHLELGKVFMDLERLEEARESFRQVLERPAVRPTDPLHKQEAQSLLQALGS